MAIPNSVLWRLEPHTRAKHEILRRYLGAWFPILNRFNDRIYYVDGFCGPGRYLGGEPGSPLIALEVAANHRRELKGQIIFRFFDEDGTRIAHLDQELAGLNLPSHFDVTTGTGRFQDQFQALMESPSGFPGGAPAFGFVDPFGFSGFPLQLLRQFLSHSRTELLITFMVDAVNRFLTHPDPAIRKQLVTLFDSEEVLRIPQEGGKRIGKARQLYQDQLRKTARFVRYFEMRDRRDRPQYYLFFCTNSALGHVKMKEAMWALAPEGDFRFSDATNPDQLVLFENDPIAQVGPQIHQVFSGVGEIVCGEVQRLVENETAFLEKHLKEFLRREEDQGRLKVSRLKTDGTKRRAKTFPPAAVLFLD